MKSKKLVLVALLVLMGVSLFAQAAGGLDFASVWKESAFWAYIILGYLIIAIVYGFVKFKKLFLDEKIDTRNFYLKLQGYVKSENYNEAIKISEAFKKTTLGFIFWSGLKVFVDQQKSGVQGKELKRSVQRAFDEASLQKIPKIESGLFWFEILANISTLTGLLGTIYGLILAFSALEGKVGSEQQEALTGGIKAAMGTTGMGLIVAIPTTIIQGALRNRAEKIMNDIDEYSVKMINKINANIKE